MMYSTHFTIDVSMGPFSGGNNVKTGLRWHIVFMNSSHFLDKIM